MSAEPNSRPDDLRLANFQFDPNNRWAFSHIREVIPTANIPHDNRYILPLRSSSTADDDFSAVFQGKNQELSDIAEHQFLDGLLILRYDQIVVERYFGALTPERPHLMMSVTKSVVGLLAGRLAERGVITSG